MSIFENEEDVVSKSIEGHEKITGQEVKENKKEILVAKKKCKLCRGDGVNTLCFPGNKGNGKKYRVLCGCVTKRKLNRES